MLAIAGIHLSDIPALDYQEHLFFERAICSVTANTRRDGQEFLDLAASVPVEVSTAAGLEVDQRCSATERRCQPTAGSTTEQPTRWRWLGSSALRTSWATTGSAAIDKWSAWSAGH